MKVDKAAVGVEPGQYSSHSLVVQGFPEIKPGLQLAAGPHVVAGKQVGTPQTPQQGILRRPAANTLEATQGLDRGVVVQRGEIIQAEATIHQPLGECDDGAGLTVTETQVTQRLRLQPRQIPGPGEGVGRFLFPWKQLPEGLSQTVEYM